MTAITSSQPTADVAQTVGFTAVTSGGAGGGTFAWTSDAGLGCSASTTDLLSCQPTSPSTGPGFSVSVVWTDSDDDSSPSFGISYVVYADPTISTPVPSIPSGGVDFGQSVEFSAPASGGAGGFSYDWLGSPGGCASSGWNLTCVPTGATVNTSYTIRVLATDAYGGTTNTASTDFEVISDPLALPATFSPGSAAIDVGQTVTFAEAAPTSGAAGYSYLWTGLPNGCGSQNVRVLSCTPTPSASNTTYQVQVQVTDANGFVALAASVPYTVDGLPSVLTPAAAHPAADLGEWLNFTTRATGGNGSSYAFSWSASNGLGCSSPRGPLLSCRPTGTGTFTVSVHVVDANGGSATATLSSFVVHSDPVVLVPQARYSLGVDAGQDAVFIANPEGGSGSWSGFLWFGLPAEGCQQNFASVSCPMPTPTNLSVSYEVVDADGFVSSMSPLLPYQVYRDLGVAAFTASPASIDLGQEVTFTVLTYGGSFGLNFSWVGLPSGCVSANPAVGPSFLRCTPTTVGAYQLVVYVNDSSVLNVSSPELNFTVFLTPTVQAGLLSRSLVDVGEEFELSAAVTQVGSGGDALTWVGPGYLSCHATAPGSTEVACSSSSPSSSLSIEVVVTDSNGGTGEATYPNLTVLAAVELTVSVSTQSPSIGQSVSFLLSVAGGRAPYTYTWRFGDGSGSGSPTPVHSFASAGTYLVVVWANDSVGGSTVQALVVTVSGPTTVLGLPLLDVVLAGAGGLVLLLVLIAGGWSYARRRRDAIAEHYRRNWPSSPPAPAPTAAPKAPKSP